MKGVESRVVRAYPFTRPDPIPGPISGTRKKFRVPVHRPGTGTGTRKKMPGIPESPVYPVLFAASGKDRRSVGVAFDVTKSDQPNPIAVIRLD